MTTLIENQRLEFSIPANNQKIIEVYNKFRSGQLIVNKDYQRKLVWKKSHKINFIDSILRNFPFPEIYLAPGALDQEKLILIDEIVDGQQRLTTIRDYIEGTDIFALPSLPIKKFSELTAQEKSSFLNYEVSVRYLKNVGKEQVREIFQRINKTDYALNSTERLNAQWGSSEFVCFAKQLIEDNFESEDVLFRIPDEIRKEFVSFFCGDDEDGGDSGVFSENDISRMFALQFVMTLIATMDSQEYFTRNDKLQSYIEGFNESFPQAADLQNRLLEVTRFIRNLSIARATRWYKKANLFTLIVELDKVELSKIDRKKFSEALNDLDFRGSLEEFGLAEKENSLSSEELKYLGYAREAVNQKSAREYRADFMKNLIKAASINRASSV